MSELYQNYQNIIWRIESITPTYSAAGLKTSFFKIDDDEIPGQAGYDRSFQVAITGGSASQGITDMYRRETNFSFGVNIFYTESPKRDYLYEMISKDQRDLVWALENSDNWVGYDASNTSNDIGLVNRYVDRIDIIEDEGIWILSLEIFATIQETN